MTPRQQLADLAAQAREVVTVLAQNGCAHLDLAPEAQRQMAAWGTGPRPVTGETLETVRNELGDCGRCKLAHGRKNIVFGEGAPRSRLVFVGEGPGGDEDRQGRPFVGAAGQLLTKIIGAMGLDRQQVYICNIIKCRPPGNRNPEPDEIEACLPFLHRQLAAIKPGFICALGAVAARTLLDTDRSIFELRGKFYRFQGVPLMPTFHPAFLLRNPQKKREVWDDIKQLMQAMGIEPSP